MAFTAATCPTCLLQEYQHLSSAVCTMDKLQSTSSREKNSMRVKWFCRHHNLSFSCYLKRGIMLVDFFRIFKYATMFFPLQQHTCNIWFCSVIFLTGEEAKTMLHIFTPSSSFDPMWQKAHFLPFDLWQDSFSIAELWHAKISSEALLLLRNTEKITLRQSGQKEEA